RAVDHARGQDRSLGRAPLALEEAARDLPGGVHPLLDVDRQREEVRALARLHPPLCGREHHRLARADDDRAVGLLGELARLEGDLLVTDRDGDGLGGDRVGASIDPVPNAALNTHLYSSTLLRGEWEFESAPWLPAGARSNFHSPVARGLSPQAELLDQGAIALQIRPLQVVEQPAAAADELEQPAPRIVVLRVRAQVLRELVDPGREEGDLHLRGAGVAPVPAVLADDLLLRFLGQAHDTST